MNFEQNVFGDILKQFVPLKLKQLRDDLELGGM